MGAHFHRMGAFGAGMQAKVLNNLLAASNTAMTRLVLDWADAAGYDVKLHFVDVDPDTRWQRVQKRNAEKGDTFALEVTREMFDFMEGIWEAPDADEMEARNGTRLTP